ncbi:MAG: malto-oligosyltrehalose trehalohydrolase, partial [Actinobacteria bacterium]
MTDFAVWAPTTSQVQLRVDGVDHPMRREDGGWWRCEVDAKPGADYAYLLGEGEQLLPDPRSLWQ